MPVRARRGIEALAILLVILLGVSVLLPLTAAAAAQVTGFISTCGGPATPVPGATVTLVDANGIAPPATATTDGGGVYIFAGPPPASYTITANQSAYYGAESGTPVRFDGSVTKRIDLCMYPHGTPTSNLAVTVLNGATPVPGAKVAAFQSTNPTNRIQLVAQGTTGTTGVVNLTLWDATFQLRTSAALLPTVESSVIVSGPTSSTVNLSPVPLVLFGHVQNVGGAFLGSGVVAWLYNPLQANTSLSRVIPGTVTASFFQFETARVPSPATYTLIVDADGYLSSKESITIPGVTNPHDVTLQPAPPERYGTTVAYGTADWNNLTAWRNLTLNADSTLPGLGPANLRDLRLQIDSTLGNGDGSLSPQEITAFQAWVCSKGPAYVATDGFFTTNGHAYNSTAGPCGITVSPTLTNPNGGVWINTTTATPYKIKQAPPYLTTGAKTYFVNMTMVADSNASAYQNYTYTVVLPKKYELNTTTVVPTNAPVTTQNFTRFTVDPGVTSGKPQIRMTVSQSRNGTARAKVIAPAGKFYVQNATFTNYQAYVANNTNLTFSAGDSTDPNDHVTEANFTWRFTANLVDTRYGISPVYRYRQNGTYNVSLVMRETGGNVSFRNVTLYVDDQLPVAKIRTNRTGSGNANGLTLKVDQGIVVRFDGALSTDFAYPGTPGKILDAGYAWDFGDGTSVRTGRVQNYTFPKPGLFKVNLTVTDSVGWKGANATLNAQVNDTKAPVPAFDILDPSKDWTVITSPIEQRRIALNASKTTDDHDKVAALNFTWTIPGPVVGLETGVANHTMWGVNVSFAWQEWNNSYAVLLTVKDMGFRGNDPGKPNTGNLTRKINVQIDPLLHADLRIDAGTLKITPAEPAEGDLVTITVNVTNKLGRKTAEDVTTEVRSITGGVTTVVSSGADWFDKNGPRGPNHAIASGETVKLVFSVRLYGQGNKTVQVYVADKTEPYTWITPENRASQTLNVRQPWWQPYAIVAAVVGVIVLFVFAMYFRRKVKAGEWRPLRGRRGARAEGEEKKPRREREVKEEKKRL